MKKNVFGRQFKRDHNERKALFKGLMTQLVLHERIETTEEKAKAIKGSVEKLVTKAVKLGKNSERLLLPYLNEDAVKKMINEIAPRFTTRPGGYTRIVRLGKRFNDNATVVFIEWVEKAQPVAAADKKKSSAKVTSPSVVEAEIVTDTKKTAKTKKTTTAKPTKEKKETKPAKKTTKKEDTK